MVIPIPVSIQNIADTKGALVLQYGIDFKILPTTEHRFTLKNLDGIATYPYPALVGEVQLNNAAVVITALQVLAHTTVIKVDPESISLGLQQVKLMGRLQQAYNDPPVWVDVAHNGHAAQSLASWLNAVKRKGKLTPFFYFG